MVTALGQKIQKQNEGTDVFSVRSTQNPDVTFKGEHNAIGV